MLFLYKSTNNRYSVFYEKNYIYEKITKKVLTYIACHKRLHNLFVKYT